MKYPNPFGSGHVEVISTKHGIRVERSWQGPRYLLRLHRWLSMRSLWLHARVFIYLLPRLNSYTTRVDIDDECLASWYGLKKINKGSE